MNIVGKILVILNLLFALAVGGFLIVDFATRNNWRREYDALKREMETTRTNYGANTTTNANLVADVKRYKGEIDTERQKIVDNEALVKLKEIEFKTALDEVKQQSKDADLNFQKALAEKERLKDEVKTQLDVIKQRDDVIVKQQAEVVKYRNAAVSEESARKAVQDRLEQAIARVAELTQALQKALTGAAPDVAVRGKANPPTVYVEGKVNEISPQNADLMSVSVGSDKGVTKNQTLEVYRVNPPLYLGVLRIVEVSPHSAVGRLERVGTSNRTPVRVGDTVASSLTRN